MTRTKIPAELAQAIAITDHTALGHVTEEDIRKLCEEAASSDPYPHSVCVQGKWAAVAAQVLQDLGVRDQIKVCAVGEKHFPLDPVELPGISPVEDKVQDAIEAMEDADLFDMVLNTQVILNGNIDEAAAEIQAVRNSMPTDAPLRVICSTGVLRKYGNDEAIINACKALAKCTGKLVMKTETGFAGHGATLEDVTLMRANLPEHIGIKASGGVNAENARAMMDAGADFIGASGLLRGLLQG